MSDSDRHGNAWTLGPSQYIETRQPEFALPAAPSSHYLTMRDGCRIAVDLYLPQTGSEPAAGRFPTILILTPAAGVPSRSQPADLFVMCGRPRNTRRPIKWDLGR